MRVRKNITVFLVSIFLVTAACSKEKTISDILDDSLDEMKEIAELVCECFYEDRGYSSVQECINETTATPSQVECVKGVYKASETDLMPALECEMEKQEDYAACLKPLSCDDDFPWIACFDAYANAMDLCPDVPAAVTFDAFACYE